jgi:uncharacterized protein YndB with AHSA1/START domain
MASKPSLTLKRRLKAPAEKVFQAWTQPEQMTRWWGRMGEGTSTAETDVRVGGSFRVAFKDNTGERHEVSGKYREVVPDRKLVFTWAWYTTPERESLVTIDLKPDGDGTVLTLTHEQFFDQKACDDHRVGWMRALDNLEGIFP